MAGKTKPGSALKGINIKLKMVNDLMDVTGSAKDSWNPAEISDDMKAIAYIHSLADTWDPAQLNEALKYLGFDTIDSWNPAIIEETKNKLVKYFLPAEAAGNPITFNTYGNLPYEVSKAEVTFLPKQSGSGDPSPDNVRPISGWTEVNLERTGKNILKYDMELGSIGATGGGTPSTTQMRSKNFESIKEGLKYTYSQKDASVEIWANYYRSDNSFIERIRVGANSRTATFTPPSGATKLKMRCSLNTESVLIGENQLELGSTATTYEPYQGHTYTEPLGATYYGGKVDFVSGMATIDRVITDLGNYTYSYQSQNTQFFTTTQLDGAPTDNNWADNVICSKYVVNSSGYGTMPTPHIRGVLGGRVYFIDDNYTDSSQVKTLLTGTQLIYPLATPITLTLTPQEIELLKGQNVIWTDGDNITIKYKALLN